MGNSCKPAADNHGIQSNQSKQSAHGLELIQQKRIHAVKSKVSITVLKTGS